MKYKYCTNCRSQNARERENCFFCEGLIFVDSLDEVRSKVTRMNSKTDLIEKGEEIQGGREKGLKKSQRDLSEIMIDDKQFDALVEAQNKTTHAVRAFVLFLFIQLSGITAAYVVWTLSMSFVDQQKCYSNGTNCEGNAFLQIVAILIWIVSVILSSRAGWSELKKSEV